MKQNEMAVRRALGFIKLWDEEIGKNKPSQGRYGEVIRNWDDVDPKKYSSLLGDYANSNGAELTALWNHYKSKRLHQMVLDSAENLNIPKLSDKVQKEIKAGLAHCRKVLKIT